MPISRAHVLAVLLTLLVSGCASPFYTERGAVVGGLTGAGVGALVGDARGDAGRGAAIGTAVGTLTGALVGNGLDQVAAQNQAMIESRVGREVAGPVTTNDVIAMAAAGLSDQTITTQVRMNGMAQPVTPQDLIALKQQGVSDSVLSALLTPPAPALAAAPPPGIIVDQPPVVLAPPPIVIRGRRPCRAQIHHHGHPRRGVRWGVSVGG